MEFFFHVKINLDNLNKKTFIKVEVHKLFLIYGRILIYFTFLFYFPINTYWEVYPNRALGIYYLLVGPSGIMCLASNWFILNISVQSVSNTKRRASSQIIFLLLPGSWRLFFFMYAHSCLTIWIEHIIVFQKNLFLNQWFISDK